MSSARAARRNRPPTRRLQLRELCLIDRNGHCGTGDSSPHRTSPHARSSGGGSITYAPLPSMATAPASWGYRVEQRRRRHPRSARHPAPCKTPRRTAPHRDGAPSPHPKPPRRNTPLHSRCALLRSTACPPLPAAAERTGTGGAVRAAPPAPACIVVIDHTSPRDTPRPHPPPSWQHRHLQRSGFESCGNLA